MKILTIIACLGVSLVYSQTNFNEISIGSNQKNGKYAELNDIKVYYENYGEGVPLSLLHGLFY